MAEKKKEPQAEPQADDKSIPVGPAIAVNPLPPYYPVGGPPTREVAGERAMKLNADADAVLQELKKKSGGE